MKKIVLFALAGIITTVFISLTIASAGGNNLQVNDQEKNSSIPLDELTDSDEEVVHEEGYLGEYLLAENEYVEIYDNSTVIITRESASPSGKVATIQRIKDSVWDELVVAYKDKQVKYDLSNVLYTSVETIKWFDDETVIAICHTNPSLNVLFKCNEKDGVKAIRGSYFAIDGENEIFYADPSPHFADKRRPELIKDENDNVYYTTDTETFIYGDLTVNDKYIGFYTSTMEEGTTKLIVLDRITKKVILEVTNPVVGEIRFVYREK